MPFRTSDSAMFGLQRTYDKSIHTADCEFILSTLPLLIGHITRLPTITHDVLYWLHKDLVERAKRAGRNPH